MRLLLAAMGICVSQFAMSQITVTDADFAIGFDTVIITSSSDSVDLATTGAGITWDYSWITGDSQTIDTLFDVASTPLGYQFAFNNGILYPDHKANIAEPGMDGASNFGGGMIGLEDAYTYFKVDNAGYKLVGMAFSLSGIPSPSRHDTIMEIFQFPLNYGNSHNSSGYNKITIPSVPMIGDVIYRRQRFRTTDVDGWGTVITPFGSFDALRVVCTITGTDSIAFDPGFPIAQEIPQPLTKEYYWIANSQKIPVLKVVTRDFNGTEMIQSVEYRDSYNPSIGLEEWEVEFSVYPNPTSDLLYIDSDQAVQTAILHDMSGRIIADQLPVVDQKVDMREVTSGEYLLKVTFVDGSHATKRIVKK